MIAEGKCIFILNQHVVKADAWVPYHPGGDKAIMHMVGRDATDEVTAFVLPQPNLPIHPVTSLQSVLTFVETIQTPFTRSEGADEPIPYREGGREVDQLRAPDSRGQVQNPLRRR